ncbi:MAG: TonB-dependent receptor [Bacteroidetes bacterium]|nr:TonB-dependent receptor [Bacteroidota bacterium]
MKNTIATLLILLSLTTYAQLSITDTTKSKAIEPITIVGDKARSMPGSGEYIKTQKLEKLNQTNINNVLRIIPGVNIRDEEGFGLRPNIGLRGTPVNRSAKITVMEDGILIAPAPYADPSAYYFPTFARMQGVEVLKGSSQIKYGPYTIGGALNLISTAIPETFRGHAQVSHGSFGTNQQRVWIGDSHKNFDYVFEINRLASNGFKEIDNGGNTGFDRRDFMGKLRWHTASNAKTPQLVTLKFINSNEAGNETYLGLTYQDYRANPLRRYAATQKDKLDLNHSHVSIMHTILPCRGMTISTSAYYANTFRDWARVNSVEGQGLNNIVSDPNAYQTAYMVMTGNANGNIEFQSAARTYFSQGVQTNAQYLINKKNVTHKLQLGARYHIDNADRYATRSTYAMNNGTMILTSAGIRGNAENQIRKAQSVASYFNYDFYYRGLRVSPGVRHERINFAFDNYGNNDYARLGTTLKSATNTMNILLPGVGVNYDINKRMNVFGGAHKGFSPPGMPSVTTNTEQAKVETSINYELGYRFENKGLNAQVVGFYNDYDNILGSDNVSGGGAGTGNMFNAGKAIIEGMEVNLTYNVLLKKKAASELRLPICIAYTYTDAKFGETYKNAGGDWGAGTITKGDLIPFITPQLLTASVGIDHHKFNVTLIGRYTGTTRIKPGQSEEIIPGEFIKYNEVTAIAEFLIIDVSANFTLSEYFSAFTTVNNITNSNAIVANLPQGYRPNIPLSYILGLKANF